MRNQRARKPIITALVVAFLALPCCWWQGASTLAQSPARESEDAGTGSAGASGRASRAPAEEALLLLEEANRLRSQTAAEAEAWQAESAETRALLRALQSQRDQREARTQEVRERRVALRLETERLSAIEADLRLAQAELTEVVDQQEARFDHLREHALPGVLVARRSEDANQLDQRVAALLLALQESSTRVREIARGVQVVQTDDGERSVHVLRIGARVALWQSLDGASAGVLVHRLGESAAFFHRYSDQTPKDALRSLFAMHEGRTTPAITPLPLSIPEDLIDASPAATSDQQRAGTDSARSPSDRGGGESE